MQRRRNGYFSHNRFVGKTFYSNIHELTVFSATVPLNYVFLFEVDSW